MVRKKKLVERAATFNLDGIHGKKPCINDIICGIAERLSADEAKVYRKRSLFLGDDYWSNFSVFSKHKRKGKDKKRYRSLDLFPMDEDDYITNGYDDDLPFDNGLGSDDDIEGSVISAYKSIIFYTDITNELSYKEFHSLKEFNEYCDRENIYVPTVDASNLGYWSEIHCCLDPGDLEYGEKTLVTDRNYDVLYWSVMSTTSDSSDEGISKRKEDSNVIW